jgi:antitoxin YefM
MATIEVSYSEARERLAELWERAVADRVPIRMTRRGSSPVVLIAAEEYEGLVETVHLLRSPANAAHLIAALERAGEGTPKTHDNRRADPSDWLSLARCRDAERDSPRQAQDRPSTGSE